MKQLLLEPCFIFILLVISVTNTPTCLCVDDASYTNCSNAFSCGNNNFNLKYPFWGENRDNHCGGPNSESEKLTCEAQVPKITINFIKYRVLGWENTSQILKVARDNYWDNNVCVNGDRNSTFDNTPFQYDYDGLVNVTLFYDCPASSSPPTISSLPASSVLTFPCGGAVYYTVQPLPSSYESPCNIVVIPIFNDSLYTPDRIIEALQGGFQIEWTGNYDKCEKCTGSGGECGSVDGNFQCFCKDGPHSASCKEKSKVQLPTMIFIIVPTIISVALFFFCYYMVKRKSSLDHFRFPKYWVFTPKKSIKSVLKENFGNESATLEPLQFNLSILKAATNNFSDENRIGKGGFGEVYKGILHDGRQIAIKKLSKSSMQGSNEFKNEVLVIAKLQHRNLVTLIGFCLEEQNKILIYKYVPNKSLDYFLFDSQRPKLSWFQRYNIIGGIAQGILYLHEFSTLKVIHRDLKPSNVLLDENMVPKISDFGLARIIEINQDQGGTNRIVGTFGYMPPEYAMFGQFSDKLDVFSFGVMILEIITGKKNLSSYEPHRVADGLLSYVWRQWREETLLGVLDSSIKDNYSEIEVIRCIHIGLLCVQQNPDVRPTMATIVSYLSSYLIDLPTPQEPAFFLHERIHPISLAQESGCNQSANRSIPFSVNKMSISDFIPR
ncbi:hypothetical protein GLYMA_18G294400v4 [Glycine max]|uniref:non-specific serine/threonine protein kinase n=1 Tax=Glycine max TaxID=3847 RepID=A0A0R0F5M6_SOYBN|nr:cysteine-rich receptor-like protein kinase 19 isoform X2 [Glycine max]KRH01719.1 hypothetical protein GLYMA_18G294400v4 [Glycine max]